MSKSFLGTWDEDNRVVVVLCTSCVSLDTMETTRGSADSALTPAINRLVMDSASFGTNSFGGEDGLQWNCLKRSSMRYIEKKLYAFYWKCFLGISLLQDISWITYYQWNNISRNWTRFIVTYNITYGYTDFYMSFYVNKRNKYTVFFIYLFVIGYLDWKRQLYFLLYRYFCVNVFIFQF